MEKIRLSDFEFGALGTGKVGYIRKMNSNRLNELYPNLSEIAPNIDVWTLFAADGQPILLADERSTAIEAASSNDIMPVSLN
jgi:hypothetical protein